MKLDPRLEFYLKNRQQILDWANLQKLVYPEADKFFLSVIDDLETAAAKFPGRPKFEKSVNGSHPIAALWRPQWEEVWNKEGEPEDWFTIAFQWKRAIARFDGLWGGVNGHRIFPSGPFVRAAIQEAAIKGRFKEKKQWSAKRSLRPSREDYYANLDAYKAELLRDMEQIWRTFYPLIDGVVKKMKKKR